MSGFRLALGALLLFAPILDAQFPGRRKPTKPSAGPSDYPTLVERAHKHPRMMLRRAIAAKIARAGAAAVPAVQAYAQKKGRNALSLELVSAYQRSQAKDPTTLAMLRAWADDRDFYWRAQALGALARRKLPDELPRLRRALVDPAYLTRIEAGRGLALLDRAELALPLLDDPDPRVRMQVGRALVQAGDPRGLPSLAAALRQEQQFLDMPWGKLGATTAFKQLRRTLGQDFGYALGESVAHNRKAIERIDAEIAQRLGEAYRKARVATPDTRVYAGGVEIRSCRNGDLFLRWTASGELALGLADGPRLTLSPPGIAHCRKPPSLGKKIQGEVICDFIRLVDNRPGLDLKAAPRSLPPVANSWIQSLADQLPTKPAQAIRKRLEQFATK